MLDIWSLHLCHPALDSSSLIHYLEISLACLSHRASEMSNEWLLAMLIRDIYLNYLRTKLPENIYI